VDLSNVNINAAKKIKHSCAIKIDAIGQPWRVRRHSKNGFTFMIRFARRHLVFGLLALACGIAAAHAVTAAATPAATSILSSVDYNFVAQANLGAPFQIDSGRIAERKGTTPAIHDYAHLMVVTHVPVVDALNKVLQRKGLTAPPNTLLRGAYDTMISSLKSEHGCAFDRDYVEGQVDYQKGNAALFRYEIQSGTDPDLKEFARQTLPKIEDHLQRALKLANVTEVGRTKALRPSETRQGGSV
jgi:putative membrane protein